MSDTKTIYFNNNGEIIEPPSRIQQEGCNTVITFCAEEIVPDGFTFQSDGVDSFSFCSDVSELSCILEREEVEVTVPNPCGGELTCPVSIYAVRVVGCVRFHVNLGQLVPNQRGIDFNFGCNCTLCFDQTVCVNQVIGYVCDEDTCAEDCFSFESAFVSIDSRDQITDACGRQIVVITGGLELVFEGC